MFRAALSGAPARRFFAAHAQSCLGTGLSYVALPLLAYERFDTAWAIAAVLLPDLLPAILFGPVLGALVDRVGWRTCAVVADIVRCLALLVVMSADSLPLMIAGAAMTGIGTALFNPAALAGLPLLMSTGNSRAAGMGLFGAIDDLGLTAGPALAAILLAVISPTTLMGLNAATFAISAAMIVTIASRGGRVEPSAKRTLLGDARAGVRELASRPEIRTLLASSTGVVLCIGITNVGEVVLARLVLHIGGSGLALLVTAGGLGTILGSLCARFTTAGAGLARRLRARHRRHGRRAARLRRPALLLARRPRADARRLRQRPGPRPRPPAARLQHPAVPARPPLRAPEGLHLLRVRALLRGSGALIAGARVQTAFLVSGLGLTLVMASALPRLRAAWPTPTPGTPNALGDALA